MSYITDCLESAVYVPKIKCRDKKDLLHNIAYLMLEKQGFSKDFIENAFNCFLQRERLSSNGLGRGMACPHARYPGNFFQLGFFTVEPPINYDSVDGKPVFFIIALLIPEQAIDEYLRVLAWIGEFVSDPSVISIIKSNIKSNQLETPDQLKSLIIDWIPGN
jgi:PTS system nitrogen regulatory IIA component